MINKIPLKNFHFGSFHNLLQMLETPASQKFYLLVPHLDFPFCNVSPASCPAHDRQEEEGEMMTPLQWKT